jgi:hypothetical protein
MKTNLPDFTCHKLRRCKFWVGRLPDALLPGEKEFETLWAWEAKK